MIGGGTSADANIISGNGTGVVISDLGKDNFVEGNKIGTDASGKAKLPNAGDGIDVEDGVSLSAILNNVISGNKVNGVAIFGSTTSDNVLTGNMIGTTADGSAALPNGSNGVLIANDSSGNTIGGNAAPFANVISGNDQSGVAISFGASGNTIKGNLIGVNKADTKSLGHQVNGVVVSGNASGNYVGTISAGVGIGNVISGNSQDGVGVFTGANDNFVLANQIGTDKTGMLKIGNSNDGIAIIAADDNQVGSGTPGGSNVISGNGQDGVFISDNSTGNTVREI